VSAAHAVEAEVRLYDRLFDVDEPDGDKDVDFKDHLNPDSLKVVRAFVEPCVAETEPGETIQFERLGYYHADPEDHRHDQPVFNRTVSLRDSWKKRAGKTS